MKISWMSWSKYHTTLCYTSKKKTWRYLNSLKLLQFVNLILWRFFLVCVMQQLSLMPCWKLNIMWFQSELHLSFFDASRWWTLGIKVKTKYLNSTKDTQYLKFKSMLTFFMRSLQMCALLFTFMVPCTIEVIFKFGSKTLTSKFLHVGQIWVNEIFSGRRN